MHVKEEAQVEVDDTLAFVSATELLKLIATKQVSPVELTELFFGRIDRLDSQLNAFLELNRDEAMRVAKAAESAVVRGGELGPLHGLPISIKDNQMTRGIRTTSGSLVFKDRVPERDGAVVERVRDAGAVILGKTNVPEFAMVGTCQNRLGEPSGNPWNPQCTPGGSSGGAAAAVAAYLCPLATGSDGGGSIRIPAHFCGSYGIKPTQGRVSGFTGQGGPPKPYMLSQNGPLSRTVLDSALLLQVLAGHDPRDPTSLREAPANYVAAVDKEIAGLRVAWSPDFGFADVDPEVLDLTSTAARVFEELGCHVEESDLVMEPPYDTFGPMIDADCYASLGQYLERHGDEMTEFVHFSLERGAKVTGADYSRVLGRVNVLRARMTDLFEAYDLLLSPTACFPAFPNGEFPGEVSGKSAYPEQYWNGAFTLPINVIGHTAANVPAGLSSSGLPVGLQIVGRRGAEETVLAASAAFERARPWIGRRPPVS